MIAYLIQRRAGILSIIALVGTLLASCFSSTRKLDETIFFVGSGFKLKLVRYYDDIPLHYSGEISVIHCATDQTRSIRAHTRTQEDGWMKVEHVGGVLGSKSSAEILERVQLKPRVIDEQTLTIIGDNRFLATFDGCRTFINWNVRQLPDELITQQPRPEHCKYLATDICPGVTTFEGDRLLQFSNVRIDTQSGYISFLVKSKAFKDGVNIAVSSRDRGRTWTTKAVK
jgi:hypothetical protein